MSREVLFDVDGVVADFISHAMDFLNRIAETLGDPPTYDPSTVVTFELDSWVPPKHLTPLYELMSKPEFWLTLPVIEGAQEGIDRVRTKGLTVYWVTKPSKYCPLWLWARQEWLKKHFATDPDDIISTMHKHLVQGARFFDDKIQHVEAWESRNHNGLAYLFTTSYNRDIPRTQRVDWDTIEQAF